MKTIRFAPKAYDEFVEWAETDRDVFEKIDRMLREISRDPFRGLGKPEPLKHKHKGYWSRRITSEHRLIYKFENETVMVASLRGHYDD